MKAILSISLFDWVGIGLGLLFVLLGFCRGARWQFRRFLGVLLGIAVAGLLAPLAAPSVTALIDRNRPQAGLGVTYLFLFGLTLALLALLFRFLNPAGAKRRDEKLVAAGRTEAAPKRPLLGASFGLLTALELYLVLTVSVMHFSPGGPEGPAILKASQGAAVASRLISSLGPCFPLQTSK